VNAARSPKDPFWSDSAINTLRMFMSVKSDDQIIRESVCAENVWGVKRLPRQIWVVDYLSARWNESPTINR
jgi:hypothetical protein